MYMYTLIGTNTPLPPPPKKRKENRFLRLWFLSSCLVQGCGSSKMNIESFTSSINTFHCL